MLRINQSRLQSRLTALASIGRNESMGITRLALSAEDKLGRDQLVSWMRELALNVRIDDIGNIYGRRSGRNPDADCVLIGSHIDTVPNGGMFDGALGVVVGLEIVETLNDTNIQTDCAIEVVAFTNEEGARFDPVMMGSGAATGMLDADWVETRRARDTGATFLDELLRIGYRGERVNRLEPARVRAYLEYHVEQGPILDQQGFSCGVVEGVVGLTWLRVLVTGEANHAGTTPMGNRRDALVAASRMITAIRDIGTQHGDELVATVGRMQLKPNVTNAIPASVEFSIDIRHPQQEEIAKAVDLVTTAIRQVATEERVDEVIEEVKSVAPVTFDERVVRAITTSADTLRMTHRPLRSGAAHDAQYVSAVAPTGMIFAPSIGGISHSPEERSDWHDLAAGANVLLGAVLELSNNH